MGIIQRILGTFLTVLAGVTYVDAGTCSAAYATAYLSRCPALTTVNAPYINTITNVSNQANSGYQAAQDASNQLSSSALTTVNKLRAKDPNFYNTTLTDINIYICGHTNSVPPSRCVDSGSLSAAKDSNGNCIVVLDSASCSRQQNMCESGGDCYWLPPVNNSYSRNRRYTNDEYNAASTYVTNTYPKSFSPFIVPGVVFAVITFISWFIFCCCRCCFGRCWGRDPHKDGYTKLQVYLPIPFFIGSIIVIIVVAAVAFTKNNTITSGVNGVFDSANVTLLNVNIFAANILIPVNNLMGNITSTANQINQQLNNTGWISTQFDNIAYMLQNFSNIYTNVGTFPYQGCDTTQAWCVSCPQSVCGAAAQQVASAQSGMQSAKNVLLNTVQTMQNNIAGSADTIKSSLNSSSSQVNVLYNFTKDQSKNIQNARSSFSDFDSARLAGVLALFIISILIALIGFVGIVGGLLSPKTCVVHSLHVTWILGIIICILSFLISTILIVLAVFWNDACHFLDIVTKDFTPYGTYSATNLLNSCFQGTPLIDALGLTSQLSFSCILDDYFAQANNLVISNNFAPLTNYANTIMGYNRTIFGYNTTTETNLINTLQTASSQSGFTTTNVFTPWTVYGDANSGGSCASQNSSYQPVCYMSNNRCSLLGSGTNACNAAFQAAYYYQLSYQNIDALLARMKADYVTGVSMSSNWTSAPLNYNMSIVNASTVYSANLTSLQQNTISSLQTGVVGSINTEVDRFKCSMTCGWITNSYNILYQSACNDLLGATLTISLCIFILALALIPIIIIAIVLQKRLRGTRKGDSKSSKAEATNV